MSTGQLAVTWQYHAIEMYCMHLHNLCSLSMLWDVYVMISTVIQSRYLKSDVYDSRCRL